MATLKDYWDTTATPNEVVVYNSYPEIMTFTTTSGYSVSEIGVKLYKWEGLSGNVTLGLRELNEDGSPKSTSLATGVVDSATITTDTAGDWYYFTLNTPIALADATGYAIKITPATNDGLVWMGDGDLGYAGGKAWMWDSGWVEDDGYDLFFRTYEAIAGTNYDEGTKVVSGAGAIVLEREATGSTLGWPIERWSDYDGTQVWDEDTGQWIAVNSSGGSRYETNLVVIGQNSIGEGVIYYG